MSSVSISSVSDSEEDVEWMAKENEHQGTTPKNSKKIINKTTKK